jgi:hypothetical protein
METDYEFEIGQNVKWRRDNGDLVSAIIVDRNQNSVFIVRRDMPTQIIEIPRGLFTRLTLA